MQNNDKVSIVVARKTGSDSAINPIRNLDEEKDREPGTATATATATAEENNTDEIDGAGISRPSNSNYYADINNKKGPTNAGEADLDPETGSFQVLHVLFLSCYFF